MVNPLVLPHIDEPSLAIIAAIAFVEKSPYLAVTAQASQPPK